MPRKKAAPTILVQFRAPIPVHRALTTIARKRDMSINALVREVMTEAVAAAKAIERVRKEKQQ